MYQLFFESVPPWMIMVVAFASIYVLQPVRSTSALARRYSILLGLSLLTLIIAEGSINFGLGLKLFLIAEFPRLFLLILPLVSLSAIFLREIEPLVELAYERIQVLKEWHKRRKERADYKRERLIAQKRWEEERPAREAMELKKQQEADQRIAMQAEIARKAAEAEALAREEAKRVAEAIEKVRQQVLLAYFRASPKVQEAISWERLQEFMKTYLSQTKSVEAVKANGKRLIRTIVTHTNTKRIRKPRSLSNVINEFEQRKTEIESLPMSDSDRAALLADLEMQKALEVENCK